ncbi:MAG: Branched-chain amino acid transport system 2 carrier protein [Chlamydiae bacterium]|nr:Branched-chain amino acid transport system 2 carrier protein [Chlamydiota bacterium]
MELIRKKASFVPVGFAIFAMFFGAGNSIFPLLVGTQAANKNLFAISGLMTSGIVIPMLGLVAMFLFKGNYKEFFYRLGKAPGFFLISLIMIVIGPFAGIPRCITLSFATLKPHLGSMPLVLFSSCACTLVFFKTIKKSRLIDILGKVLTPILLTFLSIIIIKGLIGPKEIATTSISSSKVFIDGLTTGYQMMDLLAAFFFATTVLGCLKKDEDYASKNGGVPPMLMKSICLSGLLLALVYFGFSYVGAFNSISFRGLSKDALLGAVGTKVLGGKIGLVMGVAFALACLTTIITLVSVFSDFIFEEFFQKKVPYGICITLTLVAAFFFSNLGFEGIFKMVGPIVNICYPALIALTVLNILYKLYDFKPVKLPIFLIFIGSFVVNGML